MATDSNADSDIVPARESAKPVLSQSDIIGRVGSLTGAREVVSEAYRRRHADSTREGYDRSWEQFARWCEDESSRTLPMEGLGEFDPMSLIPRTEEQLAEKFPWEALEQVLLLWLTTEFAGVAPEGLDDDDYEDWVRSNTYAPATLSNVVAGIKSRASDFQPRLKWEPSSVFKGAISGLRRSLAKSYGAPRQATVLLLGHVEHIASWMTTNTEPESVTANRLIFEFLMATKGNRALFNRLTMETIDEGGKRETEKGTAYFSPGIRIPGRMRRGGKQDQTTELLFSKHPQLKAALDAWLRVRPSGDGHVLGSKTKNTTQRINDAVRAIEKMAGVEFSEGLTLSAADLKKVRAEFALSGQQAMSLVRQRDHAALLVGFFGALRRSELCALTIADLTFTQHNGRDVLYIGITRSKTDQGGLGQRVQLQRSAKAPAHMAVLDVVSAWIATLSALGCKPDDPLFPVLNAGLDAPKRSGKNQVAKGMDPEQWSQRLNALAFDSEALGPHDNLTLAQYEQVKGHSLRRGFVTSSILAGVSVVEICKQTRHKNVQMIATCADEVLAARTNWSEALYQIDEVEPDVSELEAEIERLKAELSNRAVAGFSRK